MNNYKSKEERIKENDRRIKVYTEKDPIKDKAPSTDVDLKNKESYSTSL